MSFVLCRTDITEPTSLAIEDRVVQIIGRGSVRDCNDPRISREHASVATKGKALVLRAIHLRPCFYRRRFSNLISKLSLGESVELFHGDYFGLLPETNWYELIYLKDEDADDYEDEAEAQNKNIQPDQNNEQSSPNKRPHTPDQEPGAKKIKIEPESPVKEGTVATSNIVGETQNNGKANCKDGNPQASTRDEGYVATKINPGESMDVSETDKEYDNDVDRALDLTVTVNSDDADENKEDQSLDMATDSSNNNVNVSKDATSDSPRLNNSTDSEPETPTKESAASLETSGDSSENTGTLGINDQQGSDADVPNSGSEVDVKKEAGTAGVEDVKKEAGIARAEDVKKEPQIPDAAQPGPSKDQPGQAGPSNDGAGNAPPPAAPPRERCLYGSHCYRKNPQHKAQYSHPSDADYGAFEVVPCPYGAQCHRTDPRHWAAHAHPPGAVPPQRLRNGIRVVQRRGQFFYINAHAVHFHDNYYAVEDEDGQRVDYDYEF